MSKLLGVFSVEIGLIFEPAGCSSDGAVAGAFGAVSKLFGAENQQEFDKNGRFVPDLAT